MFPLLVIAGIRAKAVQRAEYYGSSSKKKPLRDVIEAARADLRSARANIEKSGLPRLEKDAQIKRLLRRHEVTMWKLKTGSRYDQLKAEPQQAENKTEAISYAPDCKDDVPVSMTVVKQEKTTTSWKENPNDTGDKKDPFHPPAPVPALEDNNSPFATQVQVKNENVIM